jgi:hypothetical protein
MLTINVKIKNSKNKLKISSVTVVARLSQGHQILLCMSTESTKIFKYTVTVLIVSLLFIHLKKHLIVL